MDNYLFKSNNGNIYEKDFNSVLLDLGATECDVLYVHTSMNFGLPNIKLGRNEVLESMARVLYSLNVKTLILPSYTFSFCNKQKFDRLNTPTPMGSLNEYLRSKHHWQRSIDPLMSNILYGEENGFISNIGKNSVGCNSTFDLLVKSRLKVKFLFLGAKIHDCFTFMHYLEDVRNVPYRYNFDFNGLIVDGNSEYIDSYRLFIRDKDVNAGCGAKIYENMLFEKGLGQRRQLGNSSISLIELDSASLIYNKLLDLSPNFFIDEIFEKISRSTDFEYRKMVAL